MNTNRPTHRKRLPRWAGNSMLTLALALVSAPLLALSLSTAPAQVFIPQPAPNVFITLDDSSSMAPSSKWGALQTAVQTAFSADAISDAQIRLAWQALHSCTAFGDVANCGGDNRLKVLDANHRQAFLNFMSSRTPSGFLAGTPTPKAARRVLDALSANITVNSPWAATPTLELGTPLSCRKAYHIIMTDGAWTNHPVFLPSVAVGNVDGSNTTLPDGTVYSTTSAHSRLYRDSAANTLADEAFLAWSRDLQSNLANDVPAIETVSSTQNYGNASLAAYWNPRNDPATWQHLNTYTISFQADPDSTWSVAPQFDGDAYGGDLLRIAEGALTWPSPLPYGGPEEAQKVDMWHAAINGRGQFLAATSAAALTQAFRTILADIDRLSNATLTSAITVANSFVRTSTQLFLSAFQAQGWGGQLNAWTLSPGSTTATALNWQAQARLDLLAPSARVIYTQTTAGPRLFTWSQLDAAAQSQMGSETILNYLRGERAQEIQNGGGLRNRVSRLGDIVHSNAWLMPAPQRRTVEYAGHASFRQAQQQRPAMVWVGANDGMLHGFDAATGDERVAVVPRGAHSKLASLSEVNYQHSYWVDGPVFSGDANMGSDTRSDWRTVVVAALGLGGPGYVVVDATSASFAATPDAASAAVWVDASDGSDADLGHITTATAPPADDTQQSAQIVRMNNGRWAVLMGNGVNSANARAVLVVQYLDGQRERLKLVAPYTAAVGAGVANGLGAPRALDANADGNVDFVYAGDALGQLWRFDVQSSDATTWGWSDAQATTYPLFHAKGSGGQTQAIWAAPVVVKRFNQQVQVVFATGQRLSRADESTRLPQSVYSLQDDLSLTPTAVTTRETVGALTGLPAATPAGLTGPTDVGARGWIYDLPNPHERVVQALTLTQDNQVLIDSVVPGQPPEGESCSASAWGTDVHHLTIFHAVAHVLRYTAGQSNRFTLGSAGAVLSTAGQGYAVTTAGQTPVLQTISTPIHPDLSRARRISWREVLP